MSDEYFSHEEVMKILKERIKNKKKYTYYASQLKEKVSNFTNKKQKLFRPGCVVKNRKSSGLNSRSGRFDLDDFYNEKDN